MSDKITAVDLRILKLLAKNARLTYKELAELLGTTRQRISRRMNRLEQNGVILKYTVIPNYDALGYIHVILGVTVRPDVDVGELIATLKEDENVKIIQRALGSHNLVLHIIGPKDMRELEKIIAEVTKKIPGIEHLDITFVTETVKFEAL
ncbi:MULTISPECIES: Lrp/AsnC family transcriptional regulator [Thermococcus]|uniref:Transcriptional regulators n=1 Tax=Thermococcus nautili TaxID=195522 RepID=W8P3V0_9EURY|nr:MULTISPECIES: Lrp/AsnC family transcriptional regulator [Thermococcus]AHL22095.1 Transcriptional regulators [Thermococcus nautili]NJE48667.1 Lrp/AsnC family transcriptional regulator [Thermococcus sp. 9N3]NJE55327.1 Lrp/AsnC family transcriptional regulator [Thermococcus sp. 21S9]CAI1493855.1 Transcriptional regulators [Thermococcus nautili]